MKIFLWVVLCVCTNVFGQEAVEEKPDNLNRAMFTFIKQQKIENYEVREVLISEALKIKEKTAETKLKVEIDDYIKQVSAIKMDEPIPFDINKVPKKVLKKFRVKEDKFDDVTRLTHYWGDDMAFEIRFTLKNGMVLPILHTRYWGNSWAFLDSVTLMCDGQKYEYTVDDGNRDVLDSGQIKEHYSQMMDEEMLSFFRKISISEEVVDVRYKGSKGYDDRKLSKTIKEILRDAFAVLDAGK